MPTPILMDLGGPNIVALLVPFLFAAVAASLTFFIMKAVHKKKHPTDEDIAETNRQRREREKLKAKTMTSVTDKLHGKEAPDSQSKPNGLRSGKHNKKKKK